jgi:hypothetical protein
MHRPWTALALFVPVAAGAADRPSEVGAGREEMIFTPGLQRVAIDETAILILALKEGWRIVHDASM